MRTGNRGSKTILIIFGIALIAAAWFIVKEKSREKFVDTGEKKNLSANVFWGKLDQNGNGCEETYALGRKIIGPNFPRAAVLAVLSGPTAEEKRLGYFTSIPHGVALKNLLIDSAGIARADFSKELGEDIAGSCRVTHIRAQIMKTLLQFREIKGVIISIEGETQGILQP